MLRLPRLVALSSWAFLCAASAVTCLAAPSETGAPVPARPNVLFLIADDLNTRLGCYGDVAARTPAIDRLAAEGVRFERAYVQGSVCTPSRKSFLTGKSTKTVGILAENYMKQNPEAMTVGKYFRRAGYQTIAIGKVEHTDEYQDKDAWDIRAKDAGNQDNRGKQRNPVYDDADPKRQVAMVDVRRAGAKTMDGSRADRLIQFFETERDSQKPFFAALGFHSPHEPHDTTAEYIGWHPADRMPLDLAPSQANPALPYSMPRMPAKLTEAKRRQIIQGYYAAVSSMDAEVERVLAYLKEKGQLDNTIIVLTSDHGYHLGFRDLWMKHTVYPQVARVPLIVRYPAVAARGAAAPGIVELLDLFPTFTELAGLPIPDGLDGRSFVPQLRNPQAPGKPAAFIEFVTNRQVAAQWAAELGLRDPPVPAELMPPGVNVTSKAVYTERWCYIERYGSNERELYDLQRDPSAYINLVDRSENQAEVAQLAAKLHAFYPKTK